MKRLFLFAAVATASCAAILAGCGNDGEPAVPVISIGTQPTVPSAELVEGSITGSLTIAATATEGAAPTYQWYSNTAANNTGGTAISGATSATYILPATLTEGTYYYFCEVGAKGAKAVRSSVVTVTVTVTVPPTEDILTEANFPDAAFLAWLKTQASTTWGDRDGLLYTAEAGAVDRINVGNKSITSLTGIEHFTGLTSLDCSFNQLTSLDVSANLALTNFRCANNPLTSLDVSANTALTELYCSSNNLTSLDVSANTALTELYCYSNNLSSLDLSANTALTRLTCYSNNFTSLDLSANTALTRLECYGNPGDDVSVFRVKVWSGFDITTKPNFTTNVWNYGTSPNTVRIRPVYYDVMPVDILTEANFPDDNFRARLRTEATETWGDRDRILTADEAGKVTKISVSSSGIGSLKGIEYFTGLTELSCLSNNLTSLDLSANLALTELMCNGNNFTSLDLSANTELKLLSGGESVSLSLDLTNNKKLETIYWSGYNSSLVSYSLTSLKVNGLPKLKTLSIAHNHSLLSLDVSGCIALETLSCEAQGRTNAIGGGYGSMTSLNASGCASLEILDCSAQQISSLTLTGCTALRRLNAGSTRIASLDASGLPALNWLNVSITDLAQSPEATRAMMATLPARTDASLPGNIRFGGVDYGAAYYSFDPGGHPYYEDAVPNINAYLVTLGKNWTWDGMIFLRATPATEKQTIL